MGFLRGRTMKEKLEISWREIWWARKWRNMLRVAHFHDAWLCVWMRSENCRSPQVRNMDFSTSATEGEISVDLEQYLARLMLVKLLR
jgi:aspartyl/asparaginyl beta-hydroxylase (cupin superfamily)